MNGVPSAKPVYLPTGNVLSRTPSTLLTRPPPPSSSSPQKLPILSKKLGDQKTSSLSVHRGAQSSAAESPPTAAKAADDQFGAALGPVQRKARPAAREPPIDVVTLLTSNDPGNILIRELLRTRFAFNVGLNSSGQPSLNEKHFYLASTVQTYANNDTVPQTNGFVLNFPLLGDDYDNRIGQSIKMLRIRIRIRTEFGANASAFAPYDQGAPGVHYLLSRQHVTGTPGTIIQHFQTGTDPPNSSGLFNNLGIASSSIVNQCFVKSPLAKGIYSEHAFATLPPYHKGGWDHQTMTIATNGSTNGSQPTVWVTSFDIDLHGIKCDFTGGAPTGPITNQLELSQFSWGPDNTQVKWQFSSDLIFQDAVEK